MYKTLKIISRLVFGLVVACNLILTGFCADAEAAKQVKVGYVLNDGYQTVDFNGLKTGYGYEYMQRLAYLSGWEYEYIYGDFPALLKQLEEGKIDMLDYLNYTPERAEKFFFSQNEEGWESCYLYALVDNEIINPANLQTIQGKTVAVGKDTYQAGVLRKWCANKGIKLNFMEFDSMEERRAAIYAGAVDLVLEDPGLIKPADKRAVKSIAKIGEMPFYFGISKKRPDLLKELNEAHAEVLANDVFFNDHLRMKYMSPFVQFNNDISASEKAWLKAHDNTVKIGFLKDKRPFSAIDEQGELSGVISVFFNAVDSYFQDSEIKYEKVPFTGFEAMNKALDEGQVDAVFPYFGNLNVAERHNRSLTTNVLETQMLYLHSKDDKHIAPQILGVRKGGIFQKLYGEMYYPEAKVIEYSTPDAIYNAIVARKIDGGLLNSGFYDIEVHTSKVLPYLAATPLDFKCSAAFAMRSEDTALVGIMNKVVSTMDQRDIKTAVISSSQVVVQTSFADYIMDNIGYVIALLAMLLMGAGYTVLTARNEKKLKKVNEELAKTMEEVKSQVDVIDSMADAYYCIGYLDLLHDSYRFYSKDKHLMSVSGTKGVISKDFQNVIDVFVREDHKSKMLEYVCGLLESTVAIDTDHIEMDYMDLFHGWCHAEIHASERDLQGRPIAALFTSRFINREEEDENRIEDYLHRMQFEVPAILYKNSYDTVAIIDIKDRTIMLQRNALFTDWQTGKLYSYDEMNVRQLDYGIDKAIAEKLQLDYIVQQLEHEESFGFSGMTNTLEDHNLMLERKYRYLDKENGLLLYTCEDMTEKLETDTVTGEKDYAGFRRAVAKKLRRHREGLYAILCFELQNLRNINNIYRFEIGNAVLKQVAYVLKNSKLKPWVIGRGGGDQFYCLVSKQYVDYAPIAKLTNMVVEAGGHSVEVRMLCGIYMVPEDDNSVVAVMCDKAKLAIKSITNEYAAPFCVYEPEMGKNYFAQDITLLELGEAIANEEFKVYYQPIFDAKSHKVVSAESLIRWQRPDGSMVPPGSFVPILEDKGYISKIDLYVLKKVEEFQHLRAEATKLFVPVSVNLSRMDIMNEAVINSVIGSLEKARVPHEYLRFEVTESSFRDISDTGLRDLNTLRDMQSRILIDDFGTGYSSLGMLSNLEFDIIKMDMSFVRNIGKSKKNDAIIKICIDMSHNMGAKVIAEGVETQAQLDFLVALGCDYIQGYYFSKPLPEKEYAELLDKQ